jgi:hypothetical protein
MTGGTTSIPVEGVVSVRNAAGILLMARNTSYSKSVVFSCCTFRAAELKFMLVMDGINNNLAKNIPFVLTIRG